MRNGDVRQPCIYANLFNFREVAASKRFVDGIAACEERIGVALAIESESQRLASKRT